MNLGFLAAFANTKVKTAAEAATAALVAFDPKGATEAQISLMEGQLDDLGQRVAKTRREHTEATRVLDSARALRRQRLTAAEALQEQISSGDTSKGASLEKLLGIIEEAQPEIERLKEDEAHIAAYLADLNGAYDTAAGKLKTARRDLSMAERDMKHAEIEEKRAQDRADAAAGAAGIHAGGKTLNVALEAMKRKAAAAKDAAGAANLKASTLAPQDHEKDDPAIAAAMAQASGAPAKPQSPAERLAALKSAA